MGLKLEGGWEVRVKSTVPARPSPPWSWNSVRISTMVPKTCNSIDEITAAELSSLTHSRKLFQLLKSS